MNRVVAIHQPNFFPWLGYFDKIARADVFVFLDDVQFPKTGGTWSNRVKLLVGGEARWVTAAIDRNFSGTRTIREMSFLQNNPWRTKLLKTIEGSYGKHPYFDEAMALLVPLLMNPEPNIAAYNISLVTAVAKRLGLDISKLRRASELPHEGVSNELLCSITKSVGGSVYLCGGGAAAYQDETVFQRLGVGLCYQNFTHPYYLQHGRSNFEPGLSLIDAAMNLGWDEVQKIVSLSAI